MHLTHEGRNVCRLSYFFFWNLIFLLIHYNKINIINIIGADLQVKPPESKVLPRKNSPRVVFHHVRTFRACARFGVSVTRDLKTRIENEIAP